MLKSSLKVLGSACFRDKQLSLNVIGEAARLRTALVNTSRNIHSTTICEKADDKKAMIASMPKRDEGTVGEKSIQIDNIVSTVDVFPDETTPFSLHNGIPFKDLPICNIRVSRNNTIITVTNSQGIVQMIRSCGIEGFKNARKGTNIAAQATAINVGLKAVKSGITTVRVRVQGIGPGRMSSIKGLQIGGLDIVSVTDNTHISWNPPRPRKARRL